MRIHKRATEVCKDCIVPTERNGFLPRIYTFTGVAVIIGLLLALQSAHFAHVRILMSKIDMLSAVLPGVLIALTNDDRADEGAQTLIEDPTLSRAAQLKAEDMALKGYFAHTDPDGREPWHWLDTVGYQYAFAGENLAVNFSDSEDVQKAWMRSPTHRANIVKEQYTHIGIGIARGTYQGRTTTFVVQFFATPAPWATETHVALPTATEAPQVLATGSEPTTATPEPEVLGETFAALEEQPETVVAVGAFAKIATSPHHTFIRILSAFTVLFAALLAVALLTSARVRTLRVVVGGLTILLVVLGLLLYNTLSTPGVTLPTAPAPSEISVQHTA